MELSYEYVILISTLGIAAVFMIGRIGHHIRRQRNINPMGTIDISNGQKSKINPTLDQTLNISAPQIKAPLTISGEGNLLKLNPLLEQTKYLSKQVLPKTTTMSPVEYYISGLLNTPTMLPRFSFLFINQEKIPNCVEGHVHITNPIVLRMLSSITGIQVPNTLVEKELPSILEGRNFWTSTWFPSFHNGNLYMLFDSILNHMEPTCRKLELTSYILESLQYSSIQINSTIDLIGDYMKLPIHNCFDFPQHFKLMTTELRIAHKFICEARRTGKGMAIFSEVFPDIQTFDEESLFEAKTSTSSLVRRTKSKTIGVEDWIT